MRSSSETGSKSFEDPQMAESREPPCGDERDERCLTSSLACSLHLRWTFMLGPRDTSPFSVRVATVASNLAYCPRSLVTATGLPGLPAPTRPRLPRPTPFADTLADEGAEPAAAGARNARLRHPRPRQRPTRPAIHHRHRAPAPSRLPIVLTSSTPALHCHGARRAPFIGYTCHVVSRGSLVHRTAFKQGHFSKAERNTTGISTDSHQQALLLTVCMSNFKIEKVGLKRDRR